MVDQETVHTAGGLHTATAAAASAKATSTQQSWPKQTLSSVCVHSGSGVCVESRNLLQSQASEGMESKQTELTCGVSRLSGGCDICRQMQKCLEVEAYNTALHKTACLQPQRPLILVLTARLTSVLETNSTARLTLGSLAAITPPCILRSSSMEAPPDLLRERLSLFLAEFFFLDVFLVGRPGGLSAWLLGCCCCF